MAKDTTTDAPSGNIITDSVGSIAGWWTNTFGAGAGATQTGQALDAKLAAMNSVDYAPGGTIYNDIQATQGKDAADAAYTQDQMQLAAEQADTASYASQVTAAAQTGAAQGLVAAKGTVNSFFASLFKIVPASVWILGAIGLFLYFGGWGWISRNARKKLAE